MNNDIDYYAYILSKQFPIDAIVRTVASLIGISTAEIVTDWDDLDNHLIVFEIYDAIGDFPQSFEIIFLDLDYKARMPRRLEFGRLLSQKFECNLLSNLPRQDLFGYHSSNPFVYVLIKSSQPYQVVTAYDVEAEDISDDLGDGLEVAHYGLQFESLNDAPIPRLKELMPERDFKYFASVESSNDIAQNWLRDGADSLSVVIADEQRKGRGRRGRIWYTPPNVALAVSIILKPNVQTASRASMVGALAVYDLCQHIGIGDVGIKWPNDVQIKGKKVSGILPEAVWENEKLQGVILGIGVNVRNQLEDELVDIATTLESETGQALNRVELIAYLLERVDYWYSLIAKEDIHIIWKLRLNTLGQEVIVQGTGIRIVGQAVDIDADGALLIKTADDSIQRVLAGDVSLRPQT